MPLSNSPFDSNHQLRRRVIPRRLSTSLEVAAPENASILVFITDQNIYAYSTGTEWLYIPTISAPAGGVMQFHKIITGTQLMNAFTSKPVVLPGGSSWSGKLLDIASCKVWIETAGSVNITNASGDKLEIGEAAGVPYVTFDFNDGDPIAGIKPVDSMPANFSGTYATNFTGLKLYLPAAAATIGFVAEDKIHVFGTYQLIQRNPA